MNLKVGAFQIVENSDTQLLFRKPDGVLYVPDKATFMIWQALQAGFTVDEISASLDHENPQPGYKRDVNSLQQEWQKNGLLGINLPDAHLEEKQGYKLVIQSSLEKLQLVTNRRDIHDYLQQLYPTVSTDGYDIGAYISLLHVSEEDIYQLWHDENVFATCETFDDAIITTLFLIGEIATHEVPRLLVFHAGAVVCGDKTLLISAAAGKGKSTLTAALLQTGGELINDDIVPLNPGGTITSISQPLKIKTGSWDVLRDAYPVLQNQTPLKRADDLVMKHLPIAPDSRCSPGSCHRVSTIIIPEYNPAQNQAITQQLDQSQKLQAIIDAEPFFTHALTRPYLQQIIDWLSNIPAYKITYSSSCDALAAISSLPSND